MLEWLRYLANWGIHAVAAVGVVVLIYNGTIALRAKKSDRRARLHVLCGVLICAIFSAKAYFVSHLTEGLLDNLASTRAQTLPEFAENWAADLAPADREKNSRAVASIVFRDTGRFRKYVDKDGKWQAYVPTGEDLAFRDEWITQKTRLRDLADDGFGEAFRWIALALASAVLAGYSDWKRRRTGGASEV